jgi:hypothetical protein
LPLEDQQECMQKPTGDSSKEETPVVRCCSGSCCFLSELNLVALSLHLMLSPTEVRRPVPIPGGCEDFEAFRAAHDAAAQARGEACRLVARSRASAAGARPSAPRDSLQLLGPADDGSDMELSTDPDDGGGWLGPVDKSGKIPKTKRTRGSPKNVRLQVSMATVGPSPGLAHHRAAVGASARPSRSRAPSPPCKRRHVSCPPSSPAATPMDVDLCPAPQSSC